MHFVADFHHLPSSTCELNVEKEADLDKLVKDGFMIMVVMSRRRKQNYGR